MKLMTWIRWETPGEKEAVGKIIETSDRLNAIQQLTKPPYNLSIPDAQKAVDTYRQYISSKNT